MHGQSGFTSAQASLEEPSFHTAMGKKTPEAGCYSQVGPMAVK